MWSAVNETINKSGAQIAGKVSRGEAYINLEGRSEDHIREWKP
jgi:hypothetical protein